MEKPDTKCPFLKLIYMCFPVLQKKPNKQQTEIINAVNESIDQIQDIVQSELELQNLPQQNLKSQQDQQNAVDQQDLQKIEGQQ